MTARVMFSDGSKAMAHNLDDLRERWLARRQKEEYVWKVNLEPPLIYEWNNPASIEQARQWKLQAQSVLAATDMELAQLNAEGRLDARFFNVRRSRLVMQKTYYVHVMTVLNAIIKGSSATDSATDGLSVLRNTADNLKVQLTEVIKERNQLLSQLASNESMTEFEVKFLSALRAKDWAGILSMVSFTMRQEKMTPASARTFVKQETENLRRITEDNES